MLIRRETAADVPAVRTVTGAAFARPDTPVPVEVRILDGLRTSPAWLPPLSLVAIGDQEEVLGHAVCTRGYVEGFRTATDYGITPPDPAWEEAFQVRTLTAYEPTVRGTFVFAEPFNVP